MLFGTQEVGTNSYDITITRRMGTYWMLNKQVKNALGKRTISTTNPIQSQRKQSKCNATAGRTLVNINWPFKGEIYQYIQSVSISYLHYFIIIAGRNDIIYVYTSTLYECNYTRA